MNKKNKEQNATKNKHKKLIKSITRERYTTDTYATNTKTSFVLYGLHDLQALMKSRLGTMSNTDRKTASYLRTYFTWQQRKAYAHVHVPSTGALDARALEHGMNSAKLAARAFSFNRVSIKSCPTVKENPPAPVSC